MNYLNMMINHIFNKASNGKVVVWRLGIEFQVRPGAQATEYSSLDTPPSQERPKIRYLTNRLVSVLFAFLEVGLYNLGYSS